MILGLITLLIAITISVVAAYYSILGLTAIFAAAFLPIVVMGAALEAGKVMTTVWLHKNWHRAELQYKLYLVPAVFLLMFITSMGIFGFLSKAHIDQTSSSQESVAQVQRIESEIARQTAIMKRAEDRLNRLETTGSGQDATIQLQIDAEQRRIDSAYERINPAITEQQRIIDAQLKLYQDQLAKIDQQTQTLQEYIDSGDIRKAQGMVGTRADGQFGPATAAAFKRWQTQKAQERSDIVSKLETVNNNPVVKEARAEIARLRQTADAQIADSNKLINRLRSQLGQNANAQDLNNQIQEQQNIIKTANQELDQLTQKKYQLQAEYRKLEAEVGPVKYIAEFIYGDQADKNMLEQAVRWVIILLVVVFDPLALVLILAGTKQIEWSLSEKRKKQQQVEIIDHNAKLVVDYTTQIDSLTQELSSVREQLSIAEQQTHDWKTQYQSVPPDNSEKDHERTVYVDQLLSEIATKQQSLAQQELELMNIRLQYDSLQKDFDQLVSERESKLIREFELQKQLEALSADLAQLKSQNHELTQKATAQSSKPVTHDRSTIPETAKPPKFIPPPVPEAKAVEEPKIAYEPEVGFGTDFPQTPTKGDLFLRVDFKPSRLFKWNESQWIQINKISTDSYVYNHDYIEFLREKLNSGEYDWDDLSPAEKEQVEIRNK